MSLSPQRRQVTPKINNKLMRKTSTSRSPILDKTNHSRSQTKLDTQTEKYSPVNRSQILIKQNKSHSKMKFQAELTTIQKQLKNNKNKLSTCMEIYSMLQSNMQNQRCLIHNNTLSLYCLNERRILCVNCVYGLHRHRSHKVLPLKDSMDEIHTDNLKLRQLILEQIKNLDFHCRVVQQNSVVIESQMRKIISEVEQEYNKKINEIKQKYELSVRAIRQNFYPVIQRCKNIRGALEDFRYNVWKAFTMYGQNRASDDVEVMRQLLSVTVIQLCQFRPRMITKNQLDSLSRKLKLHF